MDRRIEVVIAKMKGELAVSWRTARLARLVNLSASRLRHLFKQETGATPAHYLRDLRLGRAAFLLRTTFLSVKEITSQVGLASGSHFVREFRKLYGLSPTAYRRAAREASQPRLRHKKV